MYMVKHISFFIFLLLQFAAPAQFRVKEIKGGTDPTKSRLIFPVFISNNKIVDKKINDYLQTETFYITASQTSGKKMLDEAKYIPGDSGQSGYTNMSYNIEINNKNMLSVILEIESMGAYPEYYERYFSFDSKNGEPLSSKEMFTEEGIIRIKKILIKERDKRIKERINEIRKDDEKQFAEDSVFIVERFTQCNTEANERNIFINKEGITFYGEECFPHAWRSYGAGLDIVFSNKELEKYLSGFGKRILFTK